MFHGSPFCCSNLFKYLHVAFFKTSVKKIVLRKKEVLVLEGGFPGGSDSKESAYNAGDQGSIPELGRSPGGVFLPGQSHGQRSLVGYSPRDHRVRLTEQLKMSIRAGEIKGGRSKETPQQQNQRSAASRPQSGKGISTRRQSVKKRLLDPGAQPRPCSQLKPPARSSETPALGHARQGSPQHPWQKPEHCCSSEICSGCEEGTANLPEDRGHTRLLGPTLCGSHPSPSRPWALGGTPSVLLLLLFRELGTCFSWDGEQTSFCSLIQDPTEWAGVGSPTKQVKKPVVTTLLCAAPILPSTWAQVSWSPHAGTGVMGSPHRYQGHRASLWAPGSQSQQHCLQQQEARKDLEVCSPGRT